MNEYLCDRLMKHTKAVLIEMARGFGVNHMDPKITKRKLTWVVAGAMVNAPDRVKKPKHPEKQWFVLEVIPGTETKVKRDINRRVRIDMMQDLISKVLLPRYRNVEMRGGARVVWRRKRFKNYLLVKCVDCPEVQAFIEKTKCVKGRLVFVDKFDEKGNLKVERKMVKSLLNTPEAPVALTNGEGEKILKEHRESAKKDNDGVKTGLKPGDRVRIVEGVWSDMEGTVRGVENEGGTDPVVVVEVLIMGRPAVAKVKAFRVQLKKWRDQ